MNVLHWYPLIIFLPIASPTYQILFLATSTFPMIQYFFNFILVILRHQWWGSRWFPEWELVFIVSDKRLKQARMKVGVNRLIFCRQFELVIRRFLVSLEYAERP